MRRIHASIIALAAVLAGCGPSAIPIHGRDGRPYLYVECDGIFRTIESCYAAANKACPRGYRIVENVAPRDYYNSSLVFACNPET